MRRSISELFLQLMLYIHYKKIPQLFDLLVLYITK